MRALQPATMTLLIAIAGGSGSGKSTLAEALVAATPGAVLVSEDWYYHDLAARPGFDPAGFDFDDLSIRDHDRLLADLLALRGGFSVDAPVYDFVRHRRAAGSTTVRPGPLIVVEGAHLLCTPDLANAFDFKVFVDTPPDVRFIRRLIRDQAKRGRTAPSVIAQYLATVRPAHLRLVEPSRARADLVLEDDAGAVERPDAAAIARLLAPVLAHPRLRDAGLRV